MPPQSAPPAPAVAPVQVLGLLRSPYVVQLLDQHRLGPAEWCIAVDAGTKCLQDYLRTKYSRRPATLQWVVVCLLRGLKAVHEAGYAMVRLKTQRIVAVGPVWKYAGVEEAVPMGRPVLRRWAPCNCPPEVCGRGCGRPATAGRKISEPEGTFSARI